MESIWSLEISESSPGDVDHMFFSSCMVILRMVAYMDRLDYVSMLSNELCYAETVELALCLSIILRVSQYE